VTRRRLRDRGDSAKPIIGLLDFNADGKVDAIGYDGPDDNPTTVGKSLSLLGGWHLRRRRRHEGAGHPVARPSER
jgi:hypothetical protein